MWFIKALGAREEEGKGREGWRGYGAGPGWDGGWGPGVTEGEGRKMRSEGENDREGEEEIQPSVVIKSGKIL